MCGLLTEDLQESYKTSLSESQRGEHMILRGVTCLKAGDAEKSSIPRTNCFISTAREQDSTPTTKMEHRECTTHATAS